MPVSRGLLAVLLHNFPTVEESYCANCQKCHVFMPLENPCTSGVSNCVLWVTSPELFKAYETGTVLGKPSYLWLIIWTKKKQGSRSTKLFKETQHILTTVITFYNMCLRTNCEQQQKVWPQWIKWYDLSGGVQDAKSEGASLLFCFAVSAGCTSELLLLVRCLSKSRYDSIQTPVQSKHNTYFISTVKLHVSIIHTDDLQVHMKAVC